jgi:hypothetical protein
VPVLEQRAGVDLGEQPALAKLVRDSVSIDRELGGTRHPGRAPREIAMGKGEAEGVAGTGEQPRLRIAMQQEDGERIRHV